MSEVIEVIDIVSEADSSVGNGIREGGWEEGCFGGEFGGRNHVDKE